MLSKTDRKLLATMERMAMRGSFELCYRYSEYNETSIADAGRRAGFEFINGGAFSQVFGSAAVPDKVLKITTSEIDGYHSFVEFVQKVGPTLPEDQRRYLPVIYSSEVICGVRITLMERLVSARDALHHEYGDRLKYEEWRALNGREYCIEHPGAAELRERMDNWRRGSDAAWDLHTGNVMMRADGQLVVTDPWTTYDQTPESHKYSW